MTATVVIPANLGSKVSEKGGALEGIAGITGFSREQEATLIELGSGTYSFTVA